MPNISSPSILGANADICNLIRRMLQKCTMERRKRKNFCQYSFQLLSRGLCWCWIAKMRPGAKYFFPCLPWFQCWYLEYDKKRASEAQNANEEAEEFLFISLLVALEGTVLMLNSGNEARCQISPHPYPWCQWREYDRKYASCTRNANKEAEEFSVHIFIGCSRGTVLMLNSRNEAGCQIPPTLLPLMPMLIFEIW